MRWCNWRECNNVLQNCIHSRAAQWESSANHCLVAELKVLRRTALSSSNFPNGTATYKVCFRLRVRRRWQFWGHHSRRFTRSRCWCWPSSFSSRLYIILRRGKVHLNVRFNDGNSFTWTTFLKCNKKQKPYLNKFMNFRLRYWLGKISNCVQTVSYQKCLQTKEMQAVVNE